MLLLRIVLATHLAVLVSYTAVVIGRHGMGLLPIFFGDMAGVGWPGQFNLDFLGFLVLSALWTAWRNRFSPMGLVLAVGAFFGGMGFLSVYLLVLSRGVASVEELLVGRGGNRA